MTFRSASTAASKSLGRVAIVTFDEENNQKHILTFNDRASEVQTTVKDVIAALPGTLLPSHNVCGACLTHTGALYRTRVCMAPRGVCGGGVGPSVVLPQKARRCE